MAPSPNLLGKNSIAWCLTPFGWQISPRLAPPSGLAAPTLPGSGSGMALCRCYPLAGRGVYTPRSKDMATREIVGSLSGSCKHDPAGSGAMEDHMRAELCCEALKMALGRRDPFTGLVHHSPSRDHGRAMTLRAVDRGSQYAGDTYRKALKSAGITQSPSRQHTAHAPAGQ